MIQKALLGLVAFLMISLQPFATQGVGFPGIGRAEAGVVSKAIKARIAYGIARHVIKRKAIGSARSAGSIRNVNPLFGKPGFTRNCVNCSIATDSTLAGRPASAMPSKFGQPLSVLEKRFGGKFGPPTNIQSIERKIASMPNGTRGIVYGSRGANAEGHVFNVVKQGGVVRFLDGQSGSVASTRGYQTFSMLRTN